MSVCIYFLSVLLLLLSADLGPLWDQANLIAEVEKLGSRGIHAAAIALDFVRNGDLNGAAAFTEQPANGLGVVVHKI